MYKSPHHFWNHLIGVHSICTICNKEIPKKQFNGHLNSYHKNVKSKSNFILDILKRFSIKIVHKENLEKDVVELPMKSDSNESRDDMNKMIKFASYFYLKNGGKCASCSNKFDEFKSYQNHLPCHKNGENLQKSIAIRLVSLGFRFILKGQPDLWLEYCAYSSVGRAADS